MGASAPDERDDRASASEQPIKGSPGTFTEEEEEEEEEEEGFSRRLRRARMCLVRGGSTSQGPN
jgi:hypothetical protein